MDSSNHEAETKACAGCGAGDGRITEWGMQCPRCEVLNMRYNRSLDELKAFVDNWLPRWEAVGLSRFEAYEHLKGQMLDVGRTIGPEYGTE